MSLPKMQLSIIAFLALYSSFCLASPTDLSKTPHVSRFIKLGLQNFLKNNMLKGIQNGVNPLQEIPESGSQIIEAGRLEINDADVTGFLSYGETTIEWTSYKMPQPETTNNGETVMVMGGGSIGSVVLKIASYELDLTYTNGETEKSDGVDVEFGFTNFRTMLHAQGKVTQEDVTLDELVVEIGINFNGKGNVNLNGEPGTASSLAGIFNLAFATIWNECNSPAILEGMRCQINYSIRECTSENFGWPSPCIKDEIAPETVCKKQEVNFEPGSCQSSGQMVSISVLSNVVLIFSLMFRMF